MQQFRVFAACNLVSKCDLNGRCTQGLGGIFMWSLNGDYDGTSQDLLDAMYQAVLAACVPQ